MDRLQLFQIDSILRSSGQALEADNARQRSDPNHLTLPLHGVCLIGNRVEVEGRRATANDVDDAAATVYPQLLGTGDVVNRELLSIGQSPPICQFEKAQDRLVGFLAIGNEKVRVSRRPYIAMEDHAEPADDNVLQACRVGVG